MKSWAALQKWNIPQAMFNNFRLRQLGSLLKFRSRFHPPVVAVFVF